MTSWGIASLSFIYSCSWFLPRPTLTLWRHDARNSSVIYSFLWFPRFVLTLWRHKVQNSPGIYSFLWFPRFVLILLFTCGRTWTQKRKCRRWRHSGTRRCCPPAGISIKSPTGRTGSGTTSVTHKRSMVSARSHGLKTNSMANLWCSLGEKLTFLVTNSHYDLNRSIAKTAAFWKFYRTLGS